MNHVCRWACVALASVATPAFAATASNPAPFTGAELARLARVSDPQVAPDGRRVAFVIRETDIEANRGRTDLWLVDSSATTPVARRLTQHPANDFNPRWSPDGRFVYFLSSRTGVQQVWRLALDGGDATQVTDFPLDVGSLKISPRGDRIAFSLEVFPDCATIACSKDRLEAKAKSKATGQVYDQLFVRHWDTWSNGTRSHLFTAPITVAGKVGDAVDLTKTLDGDIPSKPFGGDEEFTFSPDGERIVLSLRVAGRTEPWSTNFDLFEVRADGSGAPTNLTSANLAWDTQPVFLGDGSLAWLAMERPGFEADRFQVMLRGADGQARRLAPDWDRSVSRLSASFDGKRLLATADDIGQLALFSIDPNSGRRETVVAKGQVAEYAPAKSGVVMAWSDLASPPDLYATTSSSKTVPRRLTQVNGAALATHRLGEFEQFDFKGWNGETVHGYVVKPQGFVAGRKYPIAFVVHGGPQVSFANQWNWRWNAQALAGGGYGVVFIDFHGSPGYGQAFTDSISEDWGGKPLEDLQKGLKAATDRYTWLDENRACSLGPSYGGFMQNWIAGHWPDRFRCIVNHAGIFDQRTMYYTTEELWFTEWENGGPYFKTPEAYEKFNPANAVEQWRTPMLVIHGALDYRVPYSQGLGTFTALQRRGIESRLLYFPDENHWIQKPANVALWYGTVIDWLDQHTREAGAKGTNRANGAN